SFTGCDPGQEVALRGGLRFGRSLSPLVTSRLDQGQRSKNHKEILSGRISLASRLVHAAPRHASFPPNIPLSYDPAPPGQRQAPSLAGKYFSADSIPGPADQPGWGEKPALLPALIRGLSLPAGSLAL